MIDKKADKFLELLYDDKFYEAHEVLEEIWFPRRFEDNDEIKLIKGFINAAVSFELLKKGKKENSKKVWTTYLKYRSLLYKMDTKNYNIYHKLVREIDSLRKNKV